MRDLEIVVVAVAALAAGLLVDDWVAAAAVIALWAGIRLLSDDQDGGVPVLTAAFLFQWLQVTLGVFYFGLTGRPSPIVDGSDYRTMVLIGLGCVLALAVGLRLGILLVRRGDVPRDRREAGWRPSWPLLLACYAALILVGGVAQTLQGDYPSLRQIVVTIMVARSGLLFLVLRRCSGSSPRWGAFAGVIAVEVALGFTGFFAGFREPLVFGALALVTRARVERRVSWGGLIGISVAMVAAGTLWMGIRSEVRRELLSLDATALEAPDRFGRVTMLSAEFLRRDPASLMGGVDGFVERIWAVYYPALAVSRVPSILPHTRGAFTMGAISHVLMPRVFFPDKGELPSDSENVRRFTGLWVAGSEAGTSIAFGYGVECYIDYGLPWMFLPITAFGLLLGSAYAWLLGSLRNEEIRMPLVAVVFWSSLYLFERSLVTTVGTAAGLLVYLAIPAVLFDRLIRVPDRVADAMAYEATAGPLVVDR